MVDSMARLLFRLLKTMTRIGVKIGEQITPRYGLRSGKQIMLKTIPLFTQHTMHSRSQKIGLKTTLKHILRSGPKITQQIILSSGLRIMLRLTMLSILNYGKRITLRPMKQLMTQYITKHG